MDVTVNVGAVGKKSYGLGGAEEDILNDDVDDEVDVDVDDLLLLFLLRVLVKDVTD